MADIAVTSRCQCRGDHCKHHKSLEPCPNLAVPPISVIHDPTSQKPVAGSGYGLCEACWEAQNSKS